MNSQSLRRTCKHPVLLTFTENDLSLCLIINSAIEASSGTVAQTGPTQTLLVKSRRSISSVMGVRITRDMASVSLAFKCRNYAGFSVHL
jgi:hypothetical protein